MVPAGVRDGTRRHTKRRDRPVPFEGTWPQRIGEVVEPALGDVLAEERTRLNLPPKAIASRAGVSESAYRAFDRGERQPDLATFMAIAWTLHKDPRELFDRLLLQMGFPAGIRPVRFPTPLT